MFTGRIAIEDDGGLVGKFAEARMKESRCMRIWRHTRFETAQQHSILKA